MSDYIARREDGRWECPHCGGQIDTFADSETVASIVTAAVEAERARIVSAVEAVGEFDAWLTVAPGVRVRVMHAHDVRTTLASAAPALDAVKAEALREAADEAEAVIADGDCAEVAAPVPGEVGRAASERRGELGRQAVAARARGDFEAERSALDALALDERARGAR